MAASIDEKERGTAKRGTGGEKKSVLERFKEDAVLEGILGLREVLAGFDFLNPIGAKQSVQDARAQANALQATGNYDRAVEVATGFQEYFDIGREGQERGSSKSETVAVMLGHATGFNQAVETYKGEDRSSKELHGVDRFLRGVDAVLRLANTVSTVAGGVEAASSKIGPGLPFSSERAMNNAVAAEAKAAAQEAKAAAAETSSAMKARQPPPIIDEKKQAKALKPLEEELKAAARGTEGSITAAPKKVKNIERGLTTERPARPAKPSNTQRKQIILDYSQGLVEELNGVERQIDQLRGYRDAPALQRDLEYIRMWAKNNREEEVRELLKRLKKQVETANLSLERGAFNPAVESSELESKAGTFGATRDRPPGVPKVDSKTWGRIRKGEIVDITGFRNPPGEHMKIDPSFTPFGEHGPNYTTPAISKEAMQRLRTKFKFPPGPTNGKLTNMGKSPYLRNGERVELHHRDQYPFGPLDEKSTGFHDYVDEDVDFHPEASDPGYQSWRKYYAFFEGKSRSLGDIYNTLRRRYWINRFK